MRKFPNLGRPLWSLLVFAVIVVFNLLPLLLVRQAYAGTLSSRKITLGTSKTSTANTYSVSFVPASTTSIKAIVVDFCNGAGGGPVIGTVCSSANHPVSGITTSGSVTVTQTGTTGSPWSFTAVAPNANIGSGKALVIQLSAGTGTLSTSVPMTFSFTATNPSAVASFYARIITFSTTADSTTYDSTGSGANPGSNTVDQGSVALSTANQLTISARVQETLAFCVGTTSVDDSTTTLGADCSATFPGSCGNAVDLGILTNSTPSISPVPVATTSLPGGGNNCNGAAMVRTNASAGVVVTYFSEQNAGSGQLKVIGASCSGSSNTDQCFNDSGTQAAFSAGVEDFGVTVGGINEGSTTSYSCSYTANPNTCKLEPSTNYLGQGTAGASEAYGTSNGFAWVDTGTATNLATSTGPVDDEAMILKFAASPTITTPTGSYTVTSTYIATATF